MKTMIYTAAVLAASLALTGCAPKIGGDDYSVLGIGEVNKSFKGKIISTRPILISSKTASGQSQIGVGAVAGGVAGGLLGSQMGCGSGAIVAGTLGTLGGAMGGQLAEQKLSEVDGIEYRIKLDSGSIVCIAQGTEPRLVVGQRVTVLNSVLERNRVIPA